MKSYIKEFEYEGKEGTRKLFVMRETETQIDGFETTYLEPEKVEKLKEYFVDHEIKDNFEKSENFNAESDKPFDGDWMKSWRRYNKSKMKVTKE